MTQSALPSNPSFDHSAPSESFMAVVFRRTRYLAAILLSALLFCTLGWRFAAPPPDFYGISLLAWSTSTLLLAALVLTAILLLATAVSTLLVHPDTPHMGLCCALLGLAGLSIRGGNIHMLLQYAQAHGTYRNVSYLLALEAVQWGIIFLLAEFFARQLHDRFFANTHWITRTGANPALAPTRHTVPSELTVGMAPSIAKTLKTLNLPRIIAIPLAIAINGLLASVFLYCILQSPAKGQVLFACFAAFFLSTLLAYYAFPRVPAIVFFLAVPLAAAVGYLLGADSPGLYPGYPGIFFARALPIDYISAGVPGAIFGYYLAFHWNLHSHSSEST